MAYPDRAIRLLVAALTAGVLSAQPARAQGQCRKVLCAPVFVSQSGLITTNWIDPPAVRRPDGRVVTPDATTDFLFRFATVIPTGIPRTSMVAIAQWTPWADAAENPFTGRSFGAGEVDANPVSFVYGAVIDLLKAEETNGWLAVSFDPLAVLSPAAQPDDKRFYTKSG